MRYSIFILTIITVSRSSCKFPAENYQELFFFPYDYLKTFPLQNIAIIFVIGEDVFSLSNIIARRKYFSVNFFSRSSTASSALIKSNWKLEVFILHHFCVLSEPLTSKLGTPFSFLPHSLSISYALQFLNWMKKNLWSIYIYII